MGYLTRAVKGMIMYDRLTGHYICLLRLSVEGQVPADGPVIFTFAWRALCFCAGVTTFGEAMTHSSNIFSGTLRGSVAKWIVS